MVLTRTAGSSSVETCNNNDNSSQVGLIITLPDSDNRTDIISYRFLTSGRMIRSFLVAKDVEFRDFIDEAFALKSTFDLALIRRLLLHL